MSDEIKLAIDRAIAHDVPDVAGLLERIGDENIKLREERDDAVKTVAWVCRKLGLPEGTKLLSGEQTIAGTMHCVCADAHGYKAYIEAEKCDDKLGKIARLTHQNAALEQGRDALAAVVERCEATFRRYVETHLTKGTDDGNRKAEANRQLADMCASTNHADILAARDARVRATALREAAVEARWSGADRLADKLYYMVGAIEKEADRG